MRLPSSWGASLPISPRKEENGSRSLFTSPEPAGTARLTGRLAFLTRAIRFPTFAPAEGHRPS